MFESLKEIARLVVPNLKELLKEKEGPDVSPPSQVDEPAAEYHQEEHIELQTLKDEKPVRLRKIKFHTLKDVESEIEKLTAEFTK